MYGNFSPEVIEFFAEVVGEENFSETLFDFATCERPDGSRYGTSGHCRKGTQVESEGKASSGGFNVETAKKQRQDLAGQIVKLAMQPKLSPEQFKTMNDLQNKALALDKQIIAAGSKMEGRVQNQAAKARARIAGGTNKRVLDKASTEKEQLISRLQDKMDKAVTIKEQQRIAQAIQELKAKKPEAPLRGQNLANKMMDHQNITNRVAANHGGAIRTKAAKEEHAAELKKAGVPDRATITAALKAQRDEELGAKKVEAQGATTRALEMVKANARARGMTEIKAGGSKPTAPASTTKKSPAQGYDWRKQSGTFNKADNE